MKALVMRVHHETAAHAPAPAAPPYRFVIEAVLFLTYATFGLSWIAVTPLLGELQRDFGVGSTAVAMLNTAVSVAKVGAPLCTGWLALRLGLKRTILLGSVFVACAAGAALSPSFAGFVAGRFVFGLGGAVIVTLLGPMVMRWFPRSELPIVNAFNNVAVNTGIAVTLFATPPLAARLGWRYTLLAYAALSVLLALAWALLGRDAVASNQPAPAPTDDAPASKAAPRFIDVWRQRETWLIALAFAAPLALYLAFNTWLPRFYMETRGMDAATASRYAGLFNLVGIPAAIVGGLVTQRLGLRRPLLIGAGALVCGAALVLLFAHTPQAMLLAAALLGVGFFVGGSPLITTAMELPGSTPERASLVLGTMFSFAYLTSSASPLLVGWLRDRTGSFVPGLCLWAALSSLLALAGLLLPETGPRRRLARSA